MKVLTVNLSLTVKSFWKVFFIVFNYCLLVFGLSLARGYTLDGWEYRVYWSEADEKFRVQFSDEWKEVWVLDDVRVEEFSEGYHVVMPPDVSLVLPSLRDALDYVVNRIAYRLEHEGSVIIRGKRAVERARPGYVAEIKVSPVSPFGSVRLVFEKATPVVPAPAAWAREVRREAAGPAPTPTPSAPTPTPTVSLPRVKEVYGLGSEGMRRLRILFESTLYGLGVKPTAELKVRAEEVIYHLESKYKDVPRSEAIERAVNEFLKWIEENVYFS